MARLFSNPLASDDGEQIQPLGWARNAGGGVSW
jgi:hypothetical protein